MILLSVISKLTSLITIGTDTDTILLDGSRRMVESTLNYGTPLEAAKRNDHLQ